MSYNFNEVIDRRNTASAKWEEIKTKGYPEDTLPMWVADMEFASPPQVTEALRKRIVEHPVYGYAVNTEGYEETVCSWMKRRYSWTIQPQWIVCAPGIVCAIKMAVQAFTEPGDAIIIQKPVYYPFERSIIDNGRTMINSPLKMVNGHYEIDFADFEQKVIENNVKMFIMCTPHNPVGRVWTAEELTKLGNICLKYNVMVIADEIHADFVFAPNKFVPFLSLNKEFEKNTIVCTAPSKTFNVAGIKFSNIIIPDDKTRAGFARQLDICGIGRSNLFGCVATQAAYETGDQWVDDLVAYIKSNIDYVREYLEKEMPSLKLIEPEGLFLIWIDVSALKLTNQELTDFFIQDAHVLIDEGYLFGLEGNDYIRLNIGAPRSMVEDMMQRIKEAAVDKKLI